MARILLNFPKVQCHIAFHAETVNLKISPIKSRTYSARLGRPNFNFNPPPPPHTHIPKRASYGPIRSILKQLKLRCYV